jgi:3',5'-cyclic AMP phosphodiesterase CpdA
MLVAQVTDPHIKQEGRLAYKKIDTAANLAACVKHLLELNEKPDVVLMTGDLTDFGRPEEYALLRQLLAPLDMPLFVIPGNHDNRENFRNAFNDHDYLPHDGEFLHYAIENYPLRMIGLDTTIPGKPGGVMCSRRLSWLSGQLAAQPDKPTILFMHHPPIETGIRHMDVQNCGNAEAFGELLEQHPQVTQVLCGHVHRPVHTQWHGVTVTIAPSSSHYVALDTQENAPADWVLEPPSVQLHRWQDTRLTSHLSFIGTFDGPHPFYDADGNLID